MEQAAGKIDAPNDEGQTLPHGWAWTTLGEVAELVGGGTPSRDNPAYFTGNIVWLTPTEIPKDRIAVISDSKECITQEALRKSSARLLPKGTVLMTSRASIGYVAIAGAELATNQGFASFICNEAAHNSYLAYLLWANAEVFQQEGTGTTFKEISKSKLRTFSIPVAPIQEQRRIVEAIETHVTRLDAGVAGLKQLQAKLKRYRAAVLKAAVEGTLTAAWRAEHPDVEPAASLLQRILQERRSAWEQAELARFAKAGKTPPKGWQDRYKEPTSPVGEGSSALPKQWQLGSIEQLLIEPTCNGISVKGADRPPGVPALRLSAMSSSGFNYVDRRYIPIDEPRAESLAIRSGDFFVSRGNGSLHLVGRGTLAQVPPERVVFPDTMIRLRLSSFLPLRQYVNIMWSTGLLRRQIEAKARTTAGIYKISQRDIEAFVLPLPPLAEQEQIVAEVERRLSVAAEAEAQVEAGLKRAERLRQSILKRAFAGELVPQNPDDEPAAALLERIRHQREAGAPGEQHEQAVQLRLV